MSGFLSPTQIISFCYNINMKPDQKKYYQNLPKKRLGTSILIFNKKGELLIVKPSYKDNWILPGGVVEKNESPLQAVLRETREEINLKLKNLIFLAIDFVPQSGFKSDYLHFVFSAGQLKDKELGKIKIDNQEIIDFKFLPPSEAIKLLRKKIQRRLPACLKALKENKTFYLEQGLIK